VDRRGNLLPHLPTVFLGLDPRIHAAPTLVKAPLIPLPHRYPDLRQDDGGALLPGGKLADHFGIGRAVETAGIFVGGFACELVGIGIGQGIDPGDLAG
jgi:hypothetical protein